MTSTHTSGSGVDVRTGAPSVYDSDAPRSEPCRALLKAAAAGGASFLHTRLAAAQTTAPAPHDQAVNRERQPQFDVAHNATTADVIVETLLAWDVDHVFGMVGDGINPLIEALRKREDRIRFIGVRHQEAAAVMASGWAKATGRLGVCVATTGPRAVHLTNGLYDAHLDGEPVLAITGLTFHDLHGTRFQKSGNAPALMDDVALFNVAVTGLRHAVVVTDHACRSALGQRGVAHLAVSKDVQAQRLADDKASMRNHGLRTSAAWSRAASTPAGADVRAVAAVLNAGNRVARALGAREELERVAARLNAPVARALLGRTVLPDDSPFSTGGIGHPGTVPSEDAMHRCDTVLIIGSTMPWVDPTPARRRSRRADRSAV
ncbi:hypothetical protein BTH42_32670 [Burkholderia sp. SRS-W-2-2016]|uniref:thiamine pyrophosphate-binding protein n=1 Tax=Burkholderia sp. SRS-W-2-2016 TaxID=1926878 RepID=UPI00094B4A3C|nr:thiamine pyrophosphate-binding protein [Burkholderia sp. SRS-W-2-2016]OLL27577.1 hypothetical protein BTH42_32670 [Burkholderia sp. SRS-W-2-2016]